MRGAHGFGHPEPLGATTLCLIDFDVLARERKSGYHGSKFTCAESEGGAVMSGSLGRMVNVNGVTYVWPQRPVIVVCIDGGDPEYLETCLSDGLIPNLEGFMKRGFHNIAEGVVPSLTNPNNISIVTGSPPSVHGISGNYFLDPETGMEVMMNDPEFLRCDTILSRFSREGARVVAITAKDKLRRLLGKDVDLAGGSIVFSAERADQCTPGVNGIEGVLDIVGLPLSDVYSPELSLFVLEAGIKILERYSPDIMYLSLTDFVQHTWSPGEPEAKDFHRRLDALLGRLAEGGAVVGVTADHGMSDKSRPDDSPNVIYLQDELDARFGEGATQVVLPITDPYVVHHGALGGYARAYCRGDVIPDDVAPLRAATSRRRGGVRQAWGLRGL